MDKYLANWYARMPSKGIHFIFLDTTWVQSPLRPLEAFSKRIWMQLWIIEYCESIILARVSFSSMHSPATGLALSWNTERGHTQGLRADPSFSNSLTFSHAHFPGNSWVFTNSFIIGDYEPQIDAITNTFGQCVGLKWKWNICASKRGQHDASTQYKQPPLRHLSFLFLSLNMHKGSSYIPFAIPFFLMCWKETATFSRPFSLGMSLYATCLAIH